jgi:V8-like Glu-specific endopeptidase
MKAFSPLCSGPAHRIGATLALFSLLCLPGAQAAPPGGPLSTAVAEDVVVLCASNCTESVQIIGCDNRTQGPTTLAGATSASGPWRHVGRLDGGGTGACTGTLIGPKHVLTAAHCLINSDNEFRDGSIRFRLGQISIGPCGRPYGTHYAVRAFVPDSYDGGSSTPQNKAWDYAIVELANAIPGAVPMDFDYLSWATIQDLTSFSIGYPGDKTLATVWQTGSSNDFYTSPYQWLGSGDRGLLYVSNDGVGGQSGSPVYVFVGGQRVLVGVLIGSPPEECNQGRLWASRLTTGTVERIENAMLYPGTLDFSLRWRNIPAAQVLADEPLADCD